jgi:DNA-binding response OmpR family regulator
MNILYIEDNFNDAQLVRRYIETTPHHLTVAQDLENATELLMRDDFHLILLDIIFGVDRAGLAFARTLRAEQFTMPIVALTALATDQEMALLQRCGVNAVLVKPYQIAELARIIQHFETALS